MKLRSFYFIGILLPILLVSCRDGLSSETTDSTLLSSTISGSDVSSTESSNSGEQTSKDELLSIGNDRFVDSSLNTGGFMTDLLVGKGEVLVTGKTYDVTIIEKNKKELIFNYSEVGIVDFEKVGDSNGSFKINAKKAGGTVVTIKINENGTTFMVARLAINVRDALPLENIATFITNEVEVFRADIVSSSDSYSFLFTSQTAGTFSAKEGSTQYADINFTYKYKQEANLFGNSTYQYEVTLDDYQSAGIKLSQIYVSVTGYSVFAYDTSSFIAHFSAEFSK